MMNQLNLDIEIPDVLPISGKTGSQHLKCLRKDVKYLRDKIPTAGPHERKYYVLRLKALEWAIKTIIISENKLLLPKTPLNLFSD